MEKSNRILSIDILRGFNLVLMLFVNDLYMPGVPGWLGHTKADFDGMGLADWVFPGFMFMVGMSIPYSVGNRISKGDDKAALTTVREEITDRDAKGGVRFGCGVSSRDSNSRAPFVRSVE